MPPDSLEPSSITLIRGIPLDDLLRRKVKVVGSKGETVEISTLLGKPAVVLLGDPGMGKSTSLEAMAKSIGGRYQAVRAFLASPPGSLDGQPLFLDALDEAMAVLKNVSLLDQAAKRLGEMGWPGFWLSCRHADWARTDGKSLLEETRRAELTVVHLLPLAQEDISRTVRSYGVDARTFFTAMDEADLRPILGNPETLHLTLEIFNEHGAPKSRSDLYEKATERLAREINRKHATNGLALSAAKTKEVSGALAAALLLSGEDAVVTRGISIGHGVSVEAFESLVPVDQVEAVLASRLFTSPEPEVWAFSHRTVAEYLAARFLSDRINTEGTPLTRVLGMICGSDGEPKSSLRGLFAWLAALLPGRAHEFGDRDPYAVVAYGDTSRLPHEALLRLFRGLRRLVDIDPYFRSGRWRDPGFKAFCDPDFAPEFRDVLNERPIRPHLLSCVFDALEQGHGLPMLVTDLDAFISDVSVPTETRRSALYAYIKSASGDDAARHFRRMLGGEAEDPYRQFSSILLRELYPAVLGTEDLCDFIIRVSEMEDGGNNSLHLSLFLADRIPGGSEAEILDMMNRLPALHTRHRSPSAPQAELRLLAKVLFARAITGKDFVKPVQAASWLPIIDSDSDSIGGRDEMRAALESRSDCYVAFLLRASKTDGIERKSRPGAAMLMLQQRLPQIRPPADVVEQMLSQIETEPASPDADILYVSSLKHMIWQDPKDPALFERFWLVGNMDSHLRELRDSILFDTLENARWRWEERERVAAKADQAKRSRERIRASVIPHIEGIERGTATSVLACLARYWFGVTWHRGEIETANRSERMSNFYSPEVLSAAEKGFKILALSSEPIQPEDCIAWAEQDSYPCTVYPILAGADLVFLEAPDIFLGLAPDRLVGLLCLGFTIATMDPVNSSAIEKRPWVGRILESLPDESYTALSKLLKPQLERNLRNPVGIVELLSDDDLANTRTRLLPVLLKSVRPASRFFDMIIRSAVANLGKVDFGLLVLERLSHTPEDAPDERWQWLLLSWRLHPERHEAEVRDFVQNNDERLSQLMNELGSDQDGFHTSVSLPVTLRHRLLIVELSGPRFAPVPRPGRSWSPPTDYDRANFVHKHILAIGETAGDESGAALVSFMRDPLLSPFLDSLKHAYANWARHKQLDYAERPSTERVARALAGGAPSTSGELHAFVLEQLEDLDRSLKTARGNDWVAFWNLDGHGKPTDARPENACTKAVETFLRGSLDSAGLSSELEARHVGETRCDIKILGLDVATPIEAKCDWNPELWIGWKTQLRDRYACEPLAQGFGVYLVFWFGALRGENRAVAASPFGDVPATADECQEVLLRLMADEAPKLVPIVLDLTPLPSQSAERQVRNSEKRSRKAESKAAGKSRPS